VRTRKDVRWQAGGTLLEGGVVEDGALDALTVELALVREVGPSALDLEPVLPQLRWLTALGAVRRRARRQSGLAEAQAVIEVVWQAADRLDLVGEALIARLLIGAHERTRRVSPAAAREIAQEASGVEMRQFRARREARALRLLADKVIEVDLDEDRHAAAEAMQVGGDVAESVALYWLNLFKDHYFRMSTYAYGLETDLMTAVVQRRAGLESWRDYLSSTLWWTTQVSYYRDRFYRLHGPLWYSITEVGSEQMSDAMERIEYHDAFPDEYLSRLRVVFGRLEQFEESLFREALSEVGELDFALAKLNQWFARCSCDDVAPNPRCEVHLVIENCEVFGQTVENEFALIDGWYRAERRAANPNIRQLISEFRTERTEQRR
jgi:hypothetical protein